MLQICLIQFHRCSWIKTIFWVSNLNGDCTLNLPLMRLMLSVAVYYIWRERNARFQGDNPRTSSMILDDIFNPI